MEDNMSNVNEIIEENNEVVENPEEESGNADLVKLAVGLVGIVAAGVGALVYKNRSKIEEWQVNRLRKKGYTIVKVDVVDEDEDESTEDN